MGDADQHGWPDHTSTLDGYEKFLVDESHKYIDFIPAEHVSKNLYFPDEGPSKRLIITAPARYRCGPGRKHH